MRINSLYNEIIKGLWLLDVHQIELYAPLIEKILSGEKIESDKKESAAVMNIVNGNGGKLKTGENDEVIVPEGSIANVLMEGEITKNGNWCAYGAKDIVNGLYQAQAFKNVDATILHIDGPGGSTSSIGPFREFAKNKTKPIIGLVDQALSLHYWAAVTVCDYIIADNDVSSRFGSVGVVANWVDAQPVMEEKGYKFHTIYPPESKHKNEAFHLAREGKYDMIKKEILSPMAIKFQDGVKAALPNLRHEETGVITGKTFDADKSLGLGMIHAIGGYKDALEMAHKLAFQYQVKSTLK